MIRSQNIFVAFSLAMVLILSTSGYADVNETFDAFTQNSYGTYDYNGFHGERAVQRGWSDHLHKSTADKYRAA